MLGELKRLGKETLVYGLSAVVVRLLSFILTPFYTHLLSPAEVGIQATLFAYLAFLNIVYQYGMDQAYLRHAASGAKGDRREKFSTAMWPMAATALALSVLLAAGSRPVASALGFGGYPRVPLYCAGILALDSLAVVPFAELRLSHRAWTFVGVRVANVAVNVGLNFIFLWRYRMGVQGIFLAALAASGVSFALLLPTCAAHLRPIFNRRLCAEFFRFALPFVPAGLASQAVQVADRPILKGLTDDATVGIYQANYKLGIFMMLVVNMFDQAWRPFFLERADKPGAKELFGRVLTYFVLGGTFVVLVISLFIRELVAFPVLGTPLIHPSFWSGIPVVPVVLVGYLLNGIYVNFIAQVALTKRTDLLVWATGLGAAVNVGANLLLIPRFQMLGAAWATLLAYAAMAACLYALGQPLYPIPYENGRLIHLLAALTAVALALYGACLRLVPGAPWGWAVARVGGVLAYPSLLLATGFFNEEELGAARRKLKSWGAAALPRRRRTGRALPAPPRAG